MDDQALMTDVPSGSGRASHGRADPAPEVNWNVVVFGALTALGALLPWVSVGSISVFGITDDGDVTMVLGLAVVAAAVLAGPVVRSAETRRRIFGLVCAAGWAILLIAVWDGSRASDVAGRFGHGLALTIVSGLGIVLSSWASATRRD